MSVAVPGDHEPGIDGGADGLLVGRYRLGQVLGAGGGARVFAAHDEVLDRPVAVKLAHRAGDRSIAVQARATSRLDHPRIVRVLDLGQSAGRTWAVLELVVGRSARDLVADEGPVGIGAAIDLARAVLAGLAHAHDAGVRHGDLSPGNILVPVVDGSPRWALARLTDLAAPGRIDGQVVVSPHYAAPEVATGSPGDERSDLYSLGAVLVHLLTGAPPFDDPAPQDVLRAQVVRPAPALRSRRSDVPPELDAVVTTALAKDPDARFQDVGAMARALATIGAAPGPEPGARDAGRTTAAGPVPARRPTGPAPGTALARRPTVPVPARGTRPMPPVDGTLVRSAPPPPPAAARGAGWAVLAGLAVVVAVVLAGSSLVRSPVDDPPAIGTTVTPSPTVGTHAAPTATATRATRVPVLAGADLAVASARLAAAGLVAGTSGEQDGPAAAGTVLSSDPSAGTRVEPGAVVQLVVASGVTAVPTLAGLDQAQAAAALVAAGLALAGSTPVSADAPDGSVVASQPGPGTRLAVGGAVRLLLAAAPTPTPSASAPPTPTPTASVATG